MPKDKFLHDLKILRMFAKATHFNSCHVLKYQYQDKAGIGGLLHLHEFASLLLTPGRTSCIFHFKSSDK